MAISINIDTKQRCLFITSKSGDCFGSYKNLRKFYADIYLIDNAVVGEVVVLADFMGTDVSIVTKIGKNRYKITSKETGKVEFFKKKHLKNISHEAAMHVFGSLKY